MATSQQAKEIAKQYGWTIADTQRAIENIDLGRLSENEVLRELILFSGKELQTRQRQQAAQKALVTKLSKQISAKEKIHLEIQRIAKMYDYEQDIFRNFADFILNNLGGQNGHNAIDGEIVKIIQEKGYYKEVLDYFANFIIEGPDKRLNCNQLKLAIYEHFGVKDKESLMKSSSFRMATDGIKNINFSRIESLENIYRKIIGVLPHERYEVGYGCINGNNIFKYSLPWRIFCVNPRTVTKEKLKSAYRELAKIYHPDNLKTGDKDIFHRLQILYESVIDFV
ncbi:MAG: J domain-containing protein [Cyanobacteriota bacterium]|jgi:hypothetical protein